MTHPAALRNIRDHLRAGWFGQREVWEAELEAAAAEIERLRAEVEGLRPGDSRLHKQRTLK